MLGVMKPQREPGGAGLIIEFTFGNWLNLGFVLCKGLVPEAEMLLKLIQAHITRPALVYELNCLHVSIWKNLIS